MIERIGPVTDVSAIGHLPDAHVCRSDRIPEGQTRGLRTYAARLDLLETVGATVHSGTWLNEATHRYPAVVLGAKAAQRLGIRAPHPDAQILVGGVLFTVVGILDPVPLAPEPDYAALVGWPAAETYLDFDGHPTTVYARSVESYVEAVRAVLGPTANPRRRTRSPSPGPRTRWRRNGRPDRPSPGSCSVWGRSRCSSAGSGWPTRW
jgi:putative ABC transport system permease protein